MRRIARVTRIGEGSPLVKCEQRVSYCFHLLFQTLLLDLLSSITIPCTSSLTAPKIQTALQSTAMLYTPAYRAMQLSMGHDCNPRWRRDSDTWLGPQGPTAWIRRRAYS